MVLCNQKQSLVSRSLACQSDFAPCGLKLRLLLVSQARADSIFYSSGLMDYTSSDLSSFKIGLKYFLDF